MRHLHDIAPKDLILFLDVMEQRRSVASAVYPTAPDRSEQYLADDAGTNYPDIPSVTVELDQLLEVVPLVLHALRLRSE